MARTFLSPALLGAMFVLSPALAEAQSLLRYDDLSFFEEGLATRIGGATLRFRGLVDQAHLVEPDDAADRDETTLQLSAELEGQLDNGWNLGLLYLGILRENDDRETEHRYALFADGAWGRLSFGDVTGALDRAVTLDLGLGQARLARLRHQGALDSQGLHYSQTINAYQAHLAVDQDGEIALGLLYEAPIARGSRSFGLRLASGRLENRESATTNGDTLALSGFASYSHGALTFGAELGVEDVDTATGTDQNTHMLVGARWKSGSLSLSGELAHGDFAGTDQDAAALGLRYDVLRGLSFNAGANYLDGGAGNVWTVPISLRYEF
ncbi:MAG: porin [Silicimonas sp.]|nr:porin [Silicimonas sp.]